MDEGKHKKRRLDKGRSSNEDEKRKMGKQVSEKKKGNKKGKMLEGREIYEDNMTWNNDNDFVIKT